MNTCLRTVWFRNMLIAATFMVSVAAQASVVIQVDISDISNGNLTFIGTGASAQNNDSTTTLWSGISFVDFFTNSSWSYRYSGIAGGGYGGAGSLSGISTLVSSAGVAFDNSWVTTYYYDAAIDRVNNDLNVAGGSAPILDFSTFPPVVIDQTGPMGFSTSVAAFNGSVTFSGIAMADIPLVGQFGDIYTGYLDHVPIPNFEESTSDLGYTGEKILIGQYQVIDSSAIPEPSAYAALVGGIGFVFVFVRRRKLR